MITKNLNDIVGSGYIKTRCPNPEHEDTNPSYVIYATQGVCFGCGFRENAEQIMQRTGGVFEEASVQTRRSIRKTENLLGHINFWSKTLLHGPRQSRVQHLVTTYALSKSTIETYKIGHSGEYFTIPIWNGTVAVGVKKRVDKLFADPDAPKYLTEKGDQLFRRFPGQGAIILCEGEFDAITVSQYGFDTISNTTGSGSLPESVEPILSRVSNVPIYCASDMDDAGDKAFDGIKSICPQVKRLRWTGANDISELLARTDAGDRSTVLRELIRKAE